MTTNDTHLHLKQQTKYSKTYLKICENAQNNNRNKLKKLDENYVYYENHHILPKSIFPKYQNLKENPWNSVLLTPKEHFICHFLIMKHYKSIKYTNGERKMSYALRRLNGSNKYNSKIYELLKTNLCHSEETKGKISISQIGKFHSEETKRKISDSHKQLVWTNKHRENNKKHINKLNKDKVTCPHCNLSCDRANASKHHFNNCYKVKTPDLVICPYCNFEGEYKFIKPWHFEKCRQKPGFIDKPVHKIVMCPHCGKTGGIGNMKRYHFDNCKWRFGNEKM